MSSTLSLAYGMYGILVCQKFPLVCHVDFDIWTADALMGCGVDGYETTGPKESKCQMPRASWGLGLSLKFGTSAHRQVTTDTSHLFTLGLEKHSVPKRKDKRSCPHTFHFDL